MKHPMQKIVIDAEGTIRFQKNDIVRFLLDAGRFDLNDIAVRGFSEEDHTQFAQLIGYSVSGFGELSYADPKVVRQADRKAEKLLK